MDNLAPCAMWTSDVGGKQNYDGKIISISTRYWPSHKNESGKPSANASICLDLGPLEHEEGGSYRIWRKKDFEADTETAVKALVEAWCAEQMREIVALLGGMSAFNPAW